LKQSHPAASGRIESCLLMTAGMISQNNTPQFMLPVLKRFDREIWYG